MFRRRKRALDKLEESAKTRFEAAQYEAGVTAGQAAQVEALAAEARDLSAHNHFVDHIKQTLQPRGRPA